MKNLRVTLRNTINKLLTVSIRNGYKRDPHARENQLHIFRMETKYLQSKIFFKPSTSPKSSTRNLKPVLAQNDKKIIGELQVLKGNNRNSQINLNVLSDS